MKAVVEEIYIAAKGSVAMERVEEVRAIENGGLQGDQRLDCFQPNAKVRMMRAASDLRQGVAIVHPAEKQDHVPHDVPARIGKETSRLRDDDGAQRSGEIEQPPPPRPVQRPARLPQPGLRAACRRPQPAAARAVNPQPQLDPTVR